MTLDELIGVLERSRFGSDALDSAIADLVLSIEGDLSLTGATKPVRVYRHADGAIGEAPRYTQSLDAALKLFPECARTIPATPLKACIEALTCRLLNRK